MRTINASPKQASSAVWLPCLDLTRSSPSWGRGLGWPLRGLWCPCLSLPGTRAPGPSNLCLPAPSYPRPSTTISDTIFPFTEPEDSGCVSSSPLSLPHPYRT